MSAETLLIAGLVAWGVAAVYALVGRRIALRGAGAPSEQRRALGSFALWWYALAANIVLAGAVYFLAGLGWIDFTTHLAYAHLQRAILAVSLFGLMQYILFLFTGRDFTVPVAVFYGFYYLLLIYDLVVSNPTGVFVGDWRTDLLYAEPGRSTLDTITGLMLILPPVAGALAYGALAFRVKDVTRRYRIALVSVSLALWWIVAVIAGQRARIPDDPFQLFNRFLGLLAALTIFLAYYPPAWIQRRFNISATAS